MMEVQNLPGGSRKLCALFLMAAMLVQGGPCHLFADELKPDASTNAEITPFVDVATLPLPEGEQAMFAFLPQTGRFVMKVKRGWSGLLLLEGSLAHDRAWILLETARVGWKSDSGAIGLVPSPDPVLETVKLDQASRFVANRKGVATFRYISLPTKDRPTTLNCELRVEVEAETSELDAAILEAVPQARVKVIEVRSAAVLTGTVPTEEDAALVNTIAEQFYPTVISHVKPPTAVATTPGKIGPKWPPAVADQQKPLSAPVEESESHSSQPPTPRSNSSKSVRRQAEFNELRLLQRDVRALRDDVRQLSRLLAKRLDSGNLDRIEPLSTDPVDKHAVREMLYFMAPWCGPCQQTQPIVEKLKHDGYQIRIVDVDQNPGLAKEFNVRTIPHFVVIVDGSPRERMSGITTEDELKALLNEYRLRAKTSDMNRDAEASGTELSEDQYFEKALNQEIAVEFDDEPLSEVMKQLQKQLDVNIVLDPRGLEDEGVTTTTPVSIVVSGVSARSVLQLILIPLNLAAVVDNEVLKVTSRQRSKGEMIVISYPLHDLLESLSKPDSNGLRPSDHSKAFSQLTEVIRATIAPETWDEVGGPASMRTLDATEYLLVRQTVDVHAMIRKLLEEIRQTRQMPKMPPLKEMH